MRLTGAIANNDSDSSLPYYGISPGTAYAGLGLESLISPLYLVAHACYVDDYVSGGCDPDALGYWRDIGSPRTMSGAKRAVNRFKYH
jgi:hypothetical protein